MNKILLYLLPIIYLFITGQNMLKKDNIFSPYSWSTYYAVKRTMPVNIDGDLSEWEQDPFKPWVKDGRVYGRGTEDNGQELVASVFAVRVS